MKWVELPVDERDRLVAKKVMGWQAGECDGAIGEQANSPDGWYCQKCGYEGCWGDDYTHEELPKRYTQSMHTAWLVVQQMRTKLFSQRRRFFLEVQRLASKTSDLKDPGTVIAWPDVLFFVTPEIICLAALKTLEIEVNDANAPS